MKKLPVLTKRGAIRLAILSGLLIVACLGLWSCMIRMPGSSYSGALPAATSEEAALASALRGHVVELAETIGIRNNLAHSALERAADYMEARLKETGLAVSRQTYPIGHRAYHNIEAERRGAARPGEVVVIGAHYDSVRGCPGANDNGSGSAALLELARALSKDVPARTVRFVAFTNEEPPHYRTENMGSRVYARRCRERNENVVAMMSLETMGYYTDREGSQSYPPPLSLLYPSKGDFVCFVGNVSSRALVREAIGVFREGALFPSEGAALPGWLTGVGWSDHASFWAHGYPALMVSDTAVFRYPEYHTIHDTPDQIDYGRFARVVRGLLPVVRRWSSPPD